MNVVQVVCDRLGRIPSRYRPATFGGVAYLGFLMVTVVRAPRGMEQLTDSVTYVGRSASAGVRPWVGPLFFSVVGTGRWAIAALCVVSAFAWCAVAVAVAGWGPCTRWAAVSLYAVAAAPLLTQWHRAVLSESLGVSGLVLTLAGALGLHNQLRDAAGVSGRAVGLWLGVYFCGAVVAVGSRQSVVLFLLTSPVVVWAAVRLSPAASRRPAALVALAGCCAVGATVWQGFASSRRPYWTTLAASLVPADAPPPTAENLRLANVIYRDVMPNATFRRELMNRGMPGTPLPKGNFGGLVAFGSADMIRWLDEHGSTEYAGWVVRHPWRALQALDGYHEQLADRRGSRQHITASKSPTATDFLVARRASEVFAVISVTAVSGLIGAWMGAAWRGRFLVLLSFSLLAGLHTVAVVLSDTSDPLRHNHPAAVLLTITAALTLGATADVAVNWARRDAQALL